MLTEDVQGGTRHHVLNKLDSKQGHMKVNTAERQLTPVKTVGKRKEMEYGLVSRLQVPCPHWTSLVDTRHQGPSDLAKPHPLLSKGCPVNNFCELTFEVCAACRQRGDSLGTRRALCAVTKGRPCPLGPGICRGAAMVFARRVSENGMSRSREA